MFAGHIKVLGGPDVAQACLNHYLIEIIDTITSHEYTFFELVYFGIFNHRFNNVTRDNVGIKARREKGRNR